MNQLNESYKKKIFGLRKSSRKHRKQKCVAKKNLKKLSKLGEDLKIKFQISKEDMKQIKSCLGEMGFDVFKHVQKNNSKNKYAKEIRKFTLTLFAFSPKAHSCLRKYLSLPHERTSTKWLVVIDGNPGITEEAITYVKRKIKE